MNLGSDCVRVFCLTTYIQQKNTENYRACLNAWCKILEKKLTNVIGSKSILYPMKCTCIEIRLNGNEISVLGKPHLLHVLEKEKALKMN